LNNKYYYKYINDTKIYEIIYKYISKITNIISIIGKKILLVLIEKKYR
jgi:hypothetical protein